MKNHEKAAKITSAKTPKADSSTSESIGVAGSLASKIKEVSIRDLRPGDKVLYPGNRVIPVDTIDTFIRLRHGTEMIDETVLYVVEFVGQPQNSPVLAFREDAKIFIYAG